MSREPEKPVTETERTASEINALLTERGGYLARGLTERVEQVDAQLKARGVKPPSQQGR